MGKKILLFNISLIACLGLFISAVLLGLPVYRGSIVVHASGDGTLHNPFTISDAMTLNDASTRTMFATPNRHFVLGGDIDLSAFPNWVPIATFASGNTFDGRGYQIQNLSTERTVDNIGLFDNFLGGTVRNITFTNVNLGFQSGMTRNNGGVVAARITTGGNFFENIVVESGMIGGNATTLGGIVGEITGGSATFDRVLNNANITGTQWLGGIIGRARMNANMVTINRSGNTGNITSTGLSVGHSGGLVGVSDGTFTAVIINWSFNTGNIDAQRGNVGGLLGAQWASAAIINNSIQDGQITVAQGVHAAVATRNTAGNVSLTIDNVWFNSTLLSGMSMTNIMTGVTVTNSGSHPTTTLRTLAFLEEVNGGADEFLLRGGQITHSAFVALYTYTFAAGQGIGQNIIITQPIDDAALGMGITVPSENLPTRIGFNFHTWHFNGADYLPGATFVNTSGGNVAFVATWTAINFEIVFIQDAEYLAASPVLELNGSSHTTAMMNQTGLELVAGSWSIGNFWLARMAMGEGYTNLGDTATVSLSDRLVESLNGSEFVATHAVMTGTPRIYIRIVSNATSTVIAVEGDVEHGGFLRFAVGGGDTLTASLGGRISLARVGFITRLEAVAHPHFQFVNIQIFNDDDLLQQTLTNATTTTFSPALNLAGMQGWTIRVNFTPMEYTFNVTTSFGVTPPVANLVSYDDSITVAIGEDVSFSAVALPLVQGYRFVAWRVRIFDGNGAGYHTFPMGANVFEFIHNDINQILLARYVGSDSQILVIADFVATHSIAVNIESGQAAFGELRITVLDAITGNSSLHMNNLPNMEFAAGTIIDIVATPTALHDFGWFTVDGEFTYTATTLRIAVENSQTIVATFVHRDFIISFEARESGNLLRNVGEFYIMSDRGGYLMQRSTIMVGDTVYSVHIDKNVSTPGFRFANFTLNDEDGNSFTFDDVLSTSIVVCLDFVRENLNILTNGFTITANFIRAFVVTIEIPSGMGDVEVFVGASTIATEEREFLAGTALRIVAIPSSRFYKIDPTGAFAGINQATELDAQNADQANITNLMASRRIFARFVPITFDLDVDLIARNGGGLVIDRYEDLRTGDYITLTASTPTGRIIRNWMINGNSYRNFGNDVHVNGNSVRIRLTASWLDAFGGDLCLVNNTFDLTSIVDFRLSVGMLLLIILPSILIPLFAILVLLYVLSSRRKYAEIKKELQEATRFKATFNTGQLLRELKEGKDVGQVTKKNVKDAVKEDKKDKNNK